MCMYECMHVKFPCGQSYIVSCFDRLFALADNDGSGHVSRDELTAVLDDRASDSSALRAFLSKTAANLGVDVSRGYGVLFDMVEGPDGSGISYTDFEAFFMNAGWGNTQSVSASQASIRASHASGVSKSASTPVTPTDISYVLERCESEFKNQFVTVLKTNQGQATIHRLDAGKSYKFRVYSVNGDGVPGPKSECVIVHTTIESPPGQCASYRPPIDFLSTRGVDLSVSIAVIEASIDNSKLLLCMYVGLYTH
jgi:hypothetical protein